MVTRKNCVVHIACDSLISHVSMVSLRRATVCFTEADAISVEGVNWADYHGMSHV